MTSPAAIGWSGVVDAIHFAPRSFLPMRGVESARLLAGRGMEGDRYCNAEGFYSDRPEDGRQLTLFETETLDALRRELNIDLSPADHRRNLTTRGVPLNHLVGVRFRIGAAVVEGTRLATPCRHIEQILGIEIFTPWMHRCGLHCCIVEGGMIARGDRVEPA